MSLKISLRAASKSSRIEAQDSEKVGMETEAVKESVFCGHHVYKTLLIGFQFFPNIIGHVREAYTICDNFYMHVSLVSTLFHSFLIVSDEVSTR